MACDEMGTEYIVGKQVRERGCWEQHGKRREMTLADNTTLRKSGLAISFQSKVLIEKVFEVDFQF